MFMNYIYSIMQRYKRTQKKAYEINLASVCGFLSLSLCAWQCVSRLTPFSNLNKLEDLHVNCHEVYVIDGHSYDVLFNIPRSVTINMADVRISESQIH